MENNYTQYTVTDFAADDAFLRHYLSPTASSNAFWQQWLARNPERRQDWEDAGILVAAVLEGLTNYSRHFLTEEAEAALLARIRATNKAQDEVRPLHSAHKKYLRPALAAAAAILLICGLYLWSPRNSDAETSYAKQTSGSAVNLIERTNTSGQNQSSRLPDGSDIQLAPGSRISYAENFEKGDRTVFLSGAAVFDVVKDPSRPFLVYANEIVTRVLGTRFEVRAFEKDTDVTVRVASGRVTVYRNNQNAGNAEVHTENGGVLLLPNQQVVFDRSVQQFSKELVEKPAVLAQSKGNAQFVYEEAPVSKVFEDISAAYGVEIVFNEEALAHCQLSASLTEESLTEKMDIICKSIDATYDIVEAKIVVNSKGCTQP